VLADLVRYHLPLADVVSGDNHASAGAAAARRPAATRSSRLRMSVRSPYRIPLSGAALLMVACLGIAWPASLPGGPERTYAAGPNRPNIVLIQTDDQTTRQFTREVMPKTMRLLARHGTTFTNYIATTAQCCPSRASLLTGQYAHNHGVTSNAAGYPALTKKHNVLPMWLRRAGYRTMHVGKFLNGYTYWADPPSRVAPGWSEWYTVLRPGTHYYDYQLSINGHRRHRGHRPEDYIGRVVGRVATRLIRTHAPQRRPFYLQLDERAPHVATQDDPFSSCDHAPIPDRRDEDRFKDAPLPESPSFNEADMGDKPGFLSAAPPLDTGARKRMRKQWHCGLASLVGVDRDVAKVYHAVERSGELYKTVFIFISDNGAFFGEHRISSGKVLPYEEALRLPLLISLPKRYRGGASRVPRISKPVANIDLAPTILRLARARPCLAGGNCRTMDGRSLMPLLKRSSGWPHDRGLLTEYRVVDAGRYATCEFAGIRTRDNLYVRHSRVVNRATNKCVPVDQRERYKLKEDPFELDNLCFGGSAANCPVNSEQLDLESRLSQLRDCAGIAGRDDDVGGQPFCE
jgi:N-acetylglucosamine-6-sulfatase